MKNPVFSIIIPAYNHENYIGAAIQSVLNQTFQNFEIIVINDGSIDDTEKVIQSFTDNRIRYFFQDNHDAPYTINKGIKKSRGEYIAILNSDDVFTEKKLEESYKELTKGYDFVFGKIKVIDAFGEYIEKSNPKVAWIEEKLNNSGNDVSLSKLLLNINYVITTSNFVFRKKLVESIGFFHEQLHYSHDFDFLLKVYIANVRVKFIPHYSCFYRMHGDNTITKGKSESIIEVCYSIEKLIRNNSKAKDIIPLELFKSPIYISTLFFLSLLTDRELDTLMFSSNLRKEELKDVVMFYINNSIHIENIINEKDRITTLNSVLINEKDRITTLNNVLINEKDRITTLNNVLILENESLEEKLMVSLVKNQFMRASHFWKLRGKYIKLKKIISIVRLYSFLQKFFKRRIAKNKEHIRWLITLFNTIKKVILWVITYGVFKIVAIVRDLVDLIVNGGFRVSGILRNKVHSKSNQPLVSVVIPCYNYGRFIEEAIDSVLASTYQNIEIIVVDDGPTDEYTIELLHRLNKPKTRVIFQENQGLARARNNGIRQSKGEFILPLDADDKIDPTYIEKALYTLYTNSHCAFAYGYVQLFGVEDSVWYTGVYDLDHLKQENIIPSCTLFRKKAWEVVGGYENDRHQYDDWTFWLKLGASGFSGKLIPEILFFHRRHAGLENMTERMRLHYDEYFQKIKILLPSLYDTKTAPRLRSKMNQYIATKKDLYWKNEFSFLKISSNHKKKLLIFLPWAIRGGAEKVTLDMIKNFGDWEVFIVTTLENKYDAAVDLEFKSVAKHIYHLPNILTINDYWSFVEGLITSQKIQTVLINHCAWAYENVEKIASIDEGIHVFDLLHNTMDGGYRDWSKKYFRWITKTIVISEELKRNLIDKNGFSEDRVKCILNGIDTEGIFNPDNCSIEAYSKEFNFPRNKKGIIFIGRLSSEKNPLRFIEIAQRVVQLFPNEYFFVVVGGGDLMMEMTEKVTEHFKEGDFILLGNYSYPEKVLLGMHLLINTSLVEGMPLTIIESLSMNIPVIAPAIGAMDEIVINGKNGWLLSKNPSVEEYLDAIKRARTFNIYHDVVNETRHSVVKKYSSHRMANEYREVFLNV